MTHVRTSSGYPQSNELERWHKSLKSECVRPGTQLTREDAVRLIQTYVDHYNTVRLLSAIGYVTPHDMLVGRQSEIQPHVIASSRKRDTNTSSGGQQDRCLHIHRTRLQ